MTEPRKLKPIAALEARARQFMLMVGLGFMACVAGEILAATLLDRLSVRLMATDSLAVRFVVVSVVRGVWILFVFPVVVHLVNRFLDLPVWRTALIGVVTGAGFQAAVHVITSGVEGAFAPSAENLVWLGTLVSGTLITVWAGKQGRAWAQARQKLADAAAAARKSQYDQFLADSTALAEKRDAARAAAPPAIPAPAEPPKPD